MFSLTPRTLFRGESENETEDEVFSSSDEKLPVTTISGLSEDEIFSVPANNSPTSSPDKQSPTLDLNYSPHTPLSHCKSIIRKSLSISGRRRISFNISNETTTPVRTGVLSFDRSLRRRKRPNASPRPININPFTPGAMVESQSKKRRKTLSSFNGSLLADGEFKLDNLDFEESDDSLDQECTFFSCNDINATNSRYNNEFVELMQIGSGQFGSVFKCINKLDGCIYALKRIKKPINGKSETRALTEVYANAALGKHSRIVRYFTAWTEDDHIYIQNEYCDGGNLADLMSALKDKGGKFSEPQLKKILIHIAQGLKYIHSQNLVHLDIKPENIFISRGNIALVLKTSDSSDDGFEDSIDTDDHMSDVAYKIGDLGHVTSVVDPQVEEGDCRYMPLEILHENYNNLPKADIFALGLTIYAVGERKDLPKNGEEWHRIRDNQIPKLADCSDDFNKLLKRMINKNPELRPTSSSLLQQQILAPIANSRSQLRKELTAEKLKSEVLSRKLEEQRILLVQSSKNFMPSCGKLFRSKSLTSF